MRRWELLLLGLFILGRLYVFWLRKGESFGYDWGSHVDMLHKFTWTVPDTAIRGSFYGYHPPLGFLLARSVMLLLGTSEIVSVQIVSMIASFVGFFFLRATLQRIGALQHAAGVAFLYIACSIPLQIQIAMSINLDVLLLALSAVALYFSVGLLWENHAFHAHTGAQWHLPLVHHLDHTHRRDRLFERFIFAFGLLATIGVAPFIKFSGVLLFAIPAFVALARPPSVGWLRTAVLGAMTTCLALSMAFPYYYIRYYSNEGTFFPSNTAFLNQGGHEQAVAARDADTARWALQLFLPTPVHASRGFTEKDYTVVRLSDTWRDFWVRDGYVGPTTETAKRIGIFYLANIPWLLAIGVITFARRMRKREPWMRLGWVLLAYGLLQLTALINYIYQNPMAGWGPSKALYITPVMWAIAFLLVCAFHDRRLIPKHLRLPIRTHTLWGLSTALFVVINHFVPVY